MTNFDDPSLIATPTLQPVPDYVRWYLSGGKMHYLPFEQRQDLVDGPWNTIRELFLPSRILQLVFLSLPHLPTYGMQSIKMLSWCPLEDVEKFLRKKADHMEKDVLDSAEKQLWRQHPMHKQNRETLEAKCKEKGVQCTCTRRVFWRYINHSDCCRKYKSLQLVVSRQFFTSIIYQLKEVKINLCCVSQTFEQAPHISYLKENLKP